jgi:formylglycine-generating enzyme required for sulfatase activity
MAESAEASVPGDVQARIQAVREAATDDFTALVRIAGLDPRWDLRFFDWSGVDFSGCDLRGYDFTGANLTDCRFRGALVDGARFDGAQVDRAALRQAADWSAHARNWRPLDTRPGDRHLPNFAVFSDTPFAPELVALPAGEFLMGSPESDSEASSSERPQHRVTIGTRFALGRYPVTFEEYDQFCAATKRKKPEDQGWGRGKMPVINVSWRDAVAYCEWLTKETGQPYRLPSEAEWEYACRAGKTTRYSFGDAITEKDANFGENVGKTTEVGAYPANPWGLSDMHGNVWEWVEDVWHDSYEGAPSDGAAWTEGEGKNSSPYRVVRGGSWINSPRDLRSAIRGRVEPDYRNYDAGFRVSRTLD